jgi:hypothetical protein
MGFVKQGALFTGARITIPPICEDMNSSASTGCNSANVVALGHAFRVSREDWIYS